MTTQMYQQASERFLAQARAELANGDLPQASEKGWGAAAQLVKAIAHQRGWDHMVHGHLWTAVERLRVETGDPEVLSLFRTANTLHVNFYENRESVMSVSEGLAGVDRFLAKLSPLLKQE